MASTAAAGVFNAFAFAGAGFLFKFLDKNGYEDEMKRHNLAMEKLKAAQDKWYENEVAQKNEMQLSRQQLSDANADINKTNKALDNLRKITFENRTFTREFLTFQISTNRLMKWKNTNTSQLGWQGWLVGGGLYKLV